MKNILLTIATVIVVVAGYLYWQYTKSMDLASMYKSAKEISGSSITKDGSTWTIHMESVIDKPLEEVWTKGMKEPERSAELMPDTFRKAELKKTEGNKKFIDFQVGLLSLPVQSLQAEITWDDAAHRMTVSTTGGMQKIDATYVLESKGPAQTLLRYDATAVDQVSLPVPQSVVEGALSEFFVVQVKAIKKAVGSAETGEKKVAAGADFKSICDGSQEWFDRKLVSVTLRKATEAAPAPAADFQTETSTGYDRGYTVSGGTVAVKETFELKGRCTTAIGTAGGTTVEVQAALLAPDGIKGWVELIDWTKLASAPTPDAATAAGVYPKNLPRGWEVDPGVSGPKSDAILAFKMFEQRLF